MSKADKLWIARLVYAVGALIVSALCGENMYYRKAHIKALEELEASDD